VPMKAVPNLKEKKPTRRIRCMADAGSVDRLNRSCCGDFVSMSDIFVTFIVPGSGAPDGIETGTGARRRSNVILPLRRFRA
jgi:hypothetical protein